MCLMIGDPTVLVGPDVVIDSRRATAGSLFVALPGERVDGHDYLDDAAAAGATAAITSGQIDGVPVVQLATVDAQRGLTALARSLHAEARAGGLRTVAITGSSGKTSTKDLLAQVLAVAGPTVSPVGSFNNELGTPLTVCQIDDQTAFLVSEMGARSRGDIAHLCSIVVPSAAIVLNVGTAHLGEFGSQEAIAAAKGEIVEALDEAGWAILNADDPLVDAMASRTRARIARFTLSDQPVEAEIVVRAVDLVADDLDRFGFTLIATGTDGSTQQARVQLRVLGAHQVIDAAAAAAAGFALGLPLDQIAAALNQATNRSAWRMELHELPSGAAIINDAYNANPDSMAAALRSLAAIGQRRRAAHPQSRTIAVLGDMLELGPDADAHHRQVGELAARLGISELIAIGEFAAEVVDGTIGAGGRGRVVNAEEAAESIELAPTDVALVKASRGLELNKLVDQLVGKEVAG